MAYPNEVSATTVAARHNEVLREALYAERNALRLAAYALKRAAYHYTSLSGAGRPVAVTIHGRRR